MMVVRAVVSFEATVFGMKERSGAVLRPMEGWSEDSGRIRA